MASYYLYNHLEKLVQKDSNNKTSHAIFGNQLAKALQKVALCSIYRGPLCELIVALRDLAIATAASSAEQPVYSARGALPARSKDHSHDSVHSAEDHIARAAVVPAVGNSP